MNIMINIVNFLKLKSNLLVMKIKGEKRDTSIAVVLI